MSGRIHIDRIEPRSYKGLPSEVKIAIIEVKNHPRKALSLEVYGNNYGGPEDGPPLPKLSAGCTYREKNVGQAHADDPRRAGRRRLVFEAHNGSGQIMETYYTEEHYMKGSFIRVKN